MRSLTTLFAIVLLFSACVRAGAPSSSSPHDTRDAVAADPFNWKPCPGSDDDRWRCGRITVPMNYQDPHDNRTMQIETVLFQVGKNRSDITLLVNPGGPGDSGIQFARQGAASFSHSFSNDTFDVLGFDPRGIGASDPQISCYPDDESRDRWALLGRSYRAKGDKQVDLALWDSLNKAMYMACREKYGDILAFLDTASVARDMETIRMALQEEKLYYFGLSYGTALGLTYAGLFPDRVGRFLLDGVMDILEIRSTYGFANQSSYSARDVYDSGFIGECIRAGPERCVLASTTEGGLETVLGLQQRLENIYSGLIDQPAPASHPKIGSGVVQYDQLSSLLFFVLYSPISWARFAKTLADFERSGNATELLGYIVSNTFVSNVNACPKPARPGAGDIFPFVICGDSFDAPPIDFSTWLTLWKDFNDGAFIGGDVRFFTSFICRHYDWKTAGVYRGNLSANLSNAILLVSTRYDPITPLHNAQRMYEALGSRNAGLLIQEGYGHTSMSATSNCTKEVKRDYFLNGVLPAQSAVCDTELKPYPVGTQAQAEVGTDLLYKLPSLWRRPDGYWTV